MAPVPIAARLAELIDSEKRHASWPVQRSVAWLLRTGEMERHQRRLQRHFEKLRAEIRQAVRGWSAHRLQISGDAGGLHVIVRLDTVQATTDLEARLRNAGIHLDSMKSFKLAPNAHSGMLMSYGHMDLKDLEIALKVLGNTVARR